MVTAPPLKLSLALHEREPSVKGAKVLVLGLAYKAHAPSPHTPSASSTS
jgi:UDP-N-acetyl-D-mannosaminuronate dehydrogenase